MPQELYVLRCFSCLTFQVQIVKKVPKWKCNLCNEKQSVKKVYARGNGKDCREYVQKLNFHNGQLQENFEKGPNFVVSSESTNFEDKHLTGTSCSQYPDSKWKQFLHEENCDELPSINYERDADRDAKRSHMHLSFDRTDTSYKDQLENMQFQDSISDTFREVSDVSKTDRGSISKKRYCNMDSYKRSSPFENVDISSPVKKRSIQPTGSFQDCHKLPPDYKKSDKLYPIKEEPSKWGQFLNCKDYNNGPQNSTNAYDPLLNFSNSVKVNTNSVKGFKNVSKVSSSLQILPKSDDEHNEKQPQQENVREKATFQSIFEEQSDVNLDKLFDF